MYTVPNLTQNLSGGIHVLLKCNEPHPLTPNMRACVNDRLMNRDLLVLPRVRLSLSLSLSGSSRWLVAEKDHDQAWTLIAQHRRTNTRWATVFRGRFSFFLGISLSTIVRVVLSLACYVFCVSSTIRNSVGTWMNKPCNLLRRDIIQCHKDSKMHKEAEELEAVRLASQKDGGIRKAFSSHIPVL